MPVIQRMTTIYSAPEDRFQLAVELDDASLAELWLTQRLLQRLLPALLGWLQQQVPPDTQHAEVLQGFAQQTAREVQVVQPAVQPLPETGSWLVQSIDITPSPQVLRLVFKSKDNREASLNLEALPLRQWLNIFYDGYSQAEWPLQVWPDWVQGRLSSEKALVVH